MTTTEPTRRTLTDEQQARAEALRVAANVLGGRAVMQGQGAVPADRSTEDVTALAQWLLDGTVALDSTLESFDLHSGESDEPVRTDVLTTLVIPTVYRDTPQRLIPVGREDLRSVLDRASRLYDSGTHGVDVFDRLRDAALS